MNRFEIPSLKSNNKFELVSIECIGLVLAIDVRYECRQITSKKTSNRTIANQLKLSHTMRSSLMHRLNSAVFFSPCRPNPLTDHKSLLKCNLNMELGQ